MPDDTIADDEVLFRRIPPSHLPDPPDRVTSAHFKLRKQDIGLSVYRQKMASAEEVLRKPGAIPGSFIVQATAGDVRRLTSSDGKPLCLNVIAVGDENDPGHAEIRAPGSRKLSQSASRALKELFERQ